MGVSKILGQGASCDIGVPDEEFVEEEDEYDQDDSGIEDDLHSDKDGGEGSGSESGGEEDDAERTTSWRSAAAERAAAAVANRVGNDGGSGGLYTAAEAAKALGYEETTQNIWIDPSTGARRPVLYAADERLTSRADVVPYDELRAFDTGTSKGWGVCCAAHPQGAGAGRGDGALPDRGPVRGPRQ